MLSMVFFVSFIGVIVSFTLSRIMRMGRRPSGLPPGPPTVPILGNIHQLPTSEPHKQLQKWAQEYGPIYSLILGTQVLIVLSDGTAIKELLDKRSSLYSDRLDMYIGQTLCSGGFRFLMRGYGPKWRLFRRIGHQSLNARASKCFEHHQMIESKQLLNDMLEKPDQCLEHLRRFSNSLSTHMIYGWRTTRNDDPRLLQVFESFNNFGRLAQTGASAFMDFYPILQMLPYFLSPTKRLARQLHRKELQMYRKLWLDAKDDIAKGTSTDFICKSLAIQQKAHGFSDEDACYFAGSLLEAGSDTTSSTLYGLIQAMLLFPEVQKKAQDELDRVIGSSRLPSLIDEDSLPYIRACVKESLRWMPTAVTGAVPHAVTREDNYLGYRIPAGAGVVNNIWAIHMNPDRYPNPRQFRPERFEGDFLPAADSALSPDPAQRDHFGFGAGRRFCLGVHIAERSLFIAISQILWAFEFLPEYGVDGKPILPDPEKLTEGLAVLPQKFRVCIRPRDKLRASMIREEFSKIEVSE